MKSTRLFFGCLFPACAILLLSVTSSAQEAEPLLLTVSYVQDGKKIVEQEGYTTAEMVLQVGTTRRNYADRWDALMQMKMDSVSRAGGGLSEIMKARASVPRPAWRKAVYMNYPSEGVLTGTAQVFKRHYYEEPIEDMSWRLLSDTMTIVGYPCRSAECDFRGRTWRVWYAPDIAVDAGPWKLHGLPGLILLAEDASKDFRIECVGLEKGRPGEEMPEPYLHKFIKSSRKEIKKAITFKFKDFDGFCKSVGLPSQGWGPDGKPIKHLPETAVFMEN